MSKQAISIYGAKANNLDNLDVHLPQNCVIVITGVSGSGKSSLAFDTLYAEGQRRYVETFSPYARQFLERMDRPQARLIEGILPAIAIDQTNPVRTSRSTVGTMTEINDHLKLLFARLAKLYCGGCGAPVQADSAEDICARLLNEAPQLRAQVHFRVDVPEHFSSTEIEQWLNRQGYSRLAEQTPEYVIVVQDRLKLVPRNRARLVEALEAALRHGAGKLSVQIQNPHDESTTLHAFSNALHCAHCQSAYAQPTPSHFSFNSPLGACDNCRGFGRVIGIDYDLVIPDPHLSIAAGAIKPFQSPTNAICQRDLIKYAKRRGLSIQTPWCALSQSERRWVIEGEGGFDENVWYGIDKFFAWMESRSYKMHVRVLLSRYRSYTPCQDCCGARLKPASLLWRLGDAQATQNLEQIERHTPQGCSLSPEHIAQLPGLNIHELMCLPLEQLLRFFSQLTLPASAQEAATPVLSEIQARLHYLCEVGLGYLTLDRQSRTLSGGEVQRINLTTALGSSLVNTLFVLDEPSIGLHPRDMNRIITILRRLAARGNTLVVVEHDPLILQAADHLIDMGPGPGERGGKILYQGPVAGLQNNRESITAKYLYGSARISHARTPRPVTESSQWLKLRGVRAHNLANIDVDLPLGHLVCVSGVSGSGKSTLIHDVAWLALKKRRGEPLDPPGDYDHIEGDDGFSAIEMVNQSPIGKTARATPATYTGAFEAIRKVMAKEPLSRERGYTPGSFSFSSGLRCPECSGNGFEHIEMQFLSDVYLQCAHCNGRRYRDELLEVALIGSDERALHIADILALTVAEALQFFAHEPSICKALEPLQAVGLDYLRLGQPVPTLSGGEAQRLKIAGFLAKLRKVKGPCLFFFDEPTTGLHFADIEKLLNAFERLLTAGHSLVVIEHQQDILDAADWIVDLGPEGGAGGGQVVACGHPDAIIGSHSHTGQALSAYRQQRDQPSLGQVAEPRATYQAEPNNLIEVLGARENNLKNINLTLPGSGLSVITGLSGSGKSTLAFDILFAEGQRRYLESLNAYVRQFVQPANRADVDQVNGIAPTIAIEQRNSRGGIKSTVATLTEIYHFLRLLFVKLGVQHCPDCGDEIAAQSLDSICAHLLKHYRNREITLLAPLVHARKGLYNDLAKWAAKKGYPQLRVDGIYQDCEHWPKLDRFIEHDIELPVGSLRIKPSAEPTLRLLLTNALTLGKSLCWIVCDDEDPVAFSSARACTRCQTSFAPLDPRLFSYNSRLGWCSNCQGSGLDIAIDPEKQDQDLLTETLDTPACPVCDGRRLNPTAQAVLLDGKNIHDYTQCSIDQARKLFEQLKKNLNRRDKSIARDALNEAGSRLNFLSEVGLGYLSLNRAAPTLSGGEAQRIRLAAQLGSNLQGVTYVLDEPTIGLHPSDNQRLIKAMRRLADKGNAVIVVEHDEDTIRAADYLVDIGPGAGSEGGEIVAAGALNQVLAHPKSITADFLRRKPQPANASKKRHQHWLQLAHVRQHNLKNLSVKLPLGALVVLSGVSGSGKSTLARKVLLPSVRSLIQGGTQSDLPGALQVTGWQSIERLLEVDQTPIGKTPRSVPATYVGIWDAIRKVFANTAEATLRGYTPARFSFNTGAGRCAACEGQGQTTLMMSFLPDAKMHCELCDGARFNRETRAVTFKDKSISDILNMPIFAAAEFFAAHSAIHHCLSLLTEIGLGYLTLGQPSPTLSGGEAQRLKLVAELVKIKPSHRKRPPHTLYVLDEPTVGLHMADVEKLLRVMRRLVDAGNTLVVIEHNTDVMRAADWIIELGPEGGDAGGKLIFSGTPAQLAKKSTSPTARYLR